MEAAQPLVPEPIIAVVGEKVALGPLHRGLIPLFHRWFNDLDAAITYFRGDLRPGDPDDGEARYANMLKACSFAIYERIAMRPVGVAMLSDVDHYNRTAEFGIFIGERECRNKGYGTEATRLTLDWGFACLGLHNVLLTVFDYNQGGLTAYHRAGFREFGRRRQAKRLAGRAYDVVYMESLASEFTGSLLAARLPDEPGGATS